jgi:hypothetical protein
VTYKLQQHDVTLLHTAAVLYIHRFDTHISDSEPERETAQSRARKPRTSRTSTVSSQRRQVYRRVPFSNRSNTREDPPQPTEVEPYFGVEARLVKSCPKSHLSRIW